MNILRFFRTGRMGAGVNSRARRSRKIRPDCEWLEERAFLSADTASGSITGITAHTDLDVLSVSSTSPTGLTPEQILEAYGISGISFSSGTVSGDGAGQTIAIVDAYDDPDIASDLAEFDAEFGISAPPSFTVDNLGATKIDAGWALETALDVEWAHAIAPDANIVLVEASSDSLSALLGAVSYARNLAGVSVVSMSWGTSEFSSETQYDSVFTTPSGHENITYVAASGDTSAADGVEYPSASPDVLSVGGTTLDVSSDGTFISESAWSGSTGGFSLYESEPSYQTSTLESVGLSDGVRTTPDVAFNADPDTGLSVYDSIAYDGQSGWFVLGGTSAAAPAWAGLIAIADQGLATGGVGTLSTTEALTDLYSLPSSDFNDITTGSNGYAATAGYDLVTGLGTPRADALIAGVLADSGVSEGSTSSTGSSGSSTSSTSSSGTTSPTSASHHKKDVSTSKTKTHHTKVERTRVEKTRTVRTKAREDSLLADVDDATVSVGSTATDTKSSDSATTSASVATPSITVLATARTSDPSQSVSASSTTDAAGPDRAADSSPGQGLAPLAGSRDRPAGAASGPRSAGASDRVSTRLIARPTAAFDRARIVEAIRPWPSAIDHSIDDLDLAVEILGEGSSTGRLEPRPVGPDGMGEVVGDFGVAVLVATVALTAGGYQLAIREPVSRRRRGWSPEPRTC
jgi:hypothetical protein